MVTGRPLKVKGEAVSPVWATSATEQYTALTAGALSGWRGLIRYKGSCH